MEEWKGVLNNDEKKKFFNYFIKSIPWSPLNWWIMERCQPIQNTNNKTKGCCKHQSSPHTRKFFLKKKTKFCRRISYNILDDGKKERDKNNKKENG
jgi:hypothetical protein